MLRKLSVALLGVVLWPFSAMAQNADVPWSQFYVAGAVGQSIFWDVDLDGGGEVEFDLLGLFLSGAAGYRVSPNLRTEAELLVESADIDNSADEAEVTRLTASAYYDFGRTDMFGRSGVTPYAGGGAGVANVDIFDDEKELTFHAEGGLSVPIVDRVELVPGVRFEYTFLDGGFDDDLWITQLRVGLRYNF